jgi:hypothetical protein
MYIPKVISKWLAPIFMVLTAAVALHADGAASTRIDAVPVGSNVVRDWDGDRKVKFQFNNDGDRLGALYVNYDSGMDDPMDSVTFYFPTLKIDKNTKNILLNGKVIGNYGFRLSLDMIPGYVLRYKIVTESVDKGFDRSTLKRVLVYLEPKPSSKK